MIKPGIVDPATKGSYPREPGQSNHAGSMDQAMSAASDGWQNLAQIFHRMVPPNLFSAAVEGQLLGLDLFWIIIRVLSRADQSLPMPKPSRTFGWDYRKSF